MGSKQDTPDISMDWVCQCATVTSNNWLENSAFKAVSDIHQGVFSEYLDISNTRNTICYCWTPDTRSSSGGLLLSTLVLGMVRKKTNILKKMNLIYFHNQWTSDYFLKYFLSKFFFSKYHITMITVETFWMMCKVFV